jgi:hypothetical protein
MIGAKTMQTKRFLKGVLATVAMALVAACEQGPLPLAEPAGPTGTVTIRVTAAGAPVAAQSLEAVASSAIARTVFPAFDAFETFELTFTGERTIVMTVDAAEAAAGVTIKLVEGTYALAVKGKNGGEAIAEGTAAAPVVIDSGVTAEAAVVLSPKTGGAPGIFGYALELPGGLTAATLTLTNENGAAFNDSEGVPVGPVDLLATGATGTVEKLPPGEYRLALFIVQGIGMVRFANEAVYVYSGLESAFERDFSSVKPIKGIETLLAYLSSQPPNTAANPYPVDLGVLNLTTDLTLAQLFQALNQAGRYVALDLSSCAMSGTEFNPGRANTGEKYIVSLVLPEAATSIRAGSSDNSTFRYFTALKSVTGNEVVTLREDAFLYFYPLETIDLPKAININSYAFFSCYELTTVYLPKAETISNQAFRVCTALKTLDLPSVTSIDQLVFSYCTALTTVDLPNAITIGNEAFQGCAALIKISLPSATNIGSGAFNYSGTTALTVTLGSTAPTLGTSIFAGVSNKTVTVKVPYGATGYTPTWQNSFKQGGSNITLIIDEAPAL